MLKICPYPSTANGWTHAFHALGYSWQVTDSANWAQRSDERLKTNIVSVDNALDKILQLRPVTFDWKRPIAHGNKTGNVGFIAQEFQTVFPEAVFDGYVHEEEKDLIDGGTGLSINSDLTPYLVKSIQELATQNVILRQALALVTTQLAALKTKLSLYILIFMNIFRKNEIFIEVVQIKNSWRFILF